MFQNVRSSIVLGMILLCMLIPCDVNAQSLTVDNVSTPRRCVPVSNLQFCDRVNYTANLYNDLDVDGSLTDLEANVYYRNLVSTLDRFDCTEHFNLDSDCSLCKTSYKNWVCASMFRICGTDPDTSMTVLLPTCDGLCISVLNDCPSENLQFKCPLQGSASIYKKFDEDDLSACNNLGYTSSAYALYGHMYKVVYVMVVVMLVVMVGTLL